MIFFKKRKKGDMEKSVSVGSEKDGGHRARVQSIAVSGNNVHVFAVKYVFSFKFLYFKL